MRHLMSIIRSITCVPCVLCLTLASLAAGCGSEEPYLGCAVGVSIACTCTNGGDGAQVCLASGVYGTCDCEGTGSDAASDTGDETDGGEVDAGPDADRDASEDTSEDMSPDTTTDAAVDTPPRDLGTDATDVAEDTERPDAPADSDAPDGDREYYSPVDGSVGGPGLAREGGGPIVQCPRRVRSNH